MIFKTEIYGWDSFVQFARLKVGFLFVMDTHESRVLGDDSFGHPGQLLKWMDLRVSPILYTLLISVIFKI